MWLLKPLPSSIKLTQTDEVGDFEDVPSPVKFESVSVVSILNSLIFNGALQIDFWLRGKKTHSLSSRAAFCLQSTHKIWFLELSRLFGA